ncbi:hypothetical protein DFP72DRAFT_855634 [Ephemerocybe angulata]|uniref:Uncharacterized protein n=1 Tax=Ephemerocybe angulata TaxID=980116 RepID=A0A8H6HH48_9AGAR|nr:hypothetical protein DFP72DRAFT_855634 [Tulosesus angulatus]
MCIQASNATLILRFTGKPTRKLVNAFDTLVTRTSPFQNIRDMEESAMANMPAHDGVAPCRTHNTVPFPLHAPHPAQRIYFHIYFTIPARQSNPHNLPTYAHHSTPTPSLTEASSQLNLAPQRPPSHSTSAERGLQPRPSSQIRKTRPPGTVTLPPIETHLGRSEQPAKPRGLATRQLTKLSSQRTVARRISIQIVIANPRLGTTPPHPSSVRIHATGPSRGNAIHTIKANSGISNVTITSSHLAKTLECDCPAGAIALGSEFNDICALPMDVRTTVVHILYGIPVLHPGKPTYLGINRVD